MASQETRARITTEINTTFPNNTQKLITAEDVRKFMEVINCSKFNLADDNLASLQIQNNFILGNNVEQALQNLNRFVFPLFFVNITLRRTGGNSGSGGLFFDNLVGFNSNNPTVNVTETNNNNIDNNFIITYSNFYGASTPRGTFSLNGRGTPDLIQSNGLLRYKSGSLSTTGEGSNFQEFTRLHIFSETNLLYIADF